MSIIKKNKRGVSLVELIAAIAIIGIASSTITAAIITSYKGQLRAQQYIVANEIGKTYDAVLARDIKKSKLDRKKQGSTDSIWKESSASKSYVVLAGYDYNSAALDGLADGVLLDYITGGTTTNGVTTHSDIFNYLYSNEANDHFQLNGTTFDKTNVKIEIYMISASFGYYKTKITVKYSNNREVTYNGTHFSDN